MIKLISSLAIAVVATPAFAGTCPTDLDGDGGTGFGDLTTMLSAWGPCVGCPEDVTGDDAVGFADLTALLNAWGPCPIDTFDYPAYENEFAVVVGQQFVGAAGPIALSQDIYDRMDTDMALIRAERPEVAGSESTHMWRWVPYGLLVGIDTTLPSDDFDAALAYYQGVVLDSYFDGTILSLDFPLGANPYAMIPVLEAIDSVEYAEPNNYFGVGPLTPRWQPVSVGGGALLWTVVVAWDSGDFCDTNISPCDCMTTYEFLTQSNGTLSLLGVSSEPSPFNPNATCDGYPPTP